MDHYGKFTRKIESLAGKIFAIAGTFSPPYWRLVCNLERMGARQNAKARESAQIEQADQKGSK